MTRQPNILMIMTDQLRADCLGCYGHPLAKTPNIDALARTGTQFDRFYVASPVCMPNRASIMTSRMPSGHRGRFNGIGLGLGDVTFVDVLRQGGYDTAHFGKSHLQNFSTVPPAMLHEPQGRTPLPAALQSAVPRQEGEVYAQEMPTSWADPGHRVATPYYGFSHVDLATNHGDEIGGDYEAWLRGQVDDIDSVRGPENGVPKSGYDAPQTWCSPLKPEQWSTHYIGDRACDWLRDRAPGAAPFFASVSFPDPHHPFVVPEPYFSMYRPEDITLPDTFANRMPLPARNLHQQLADGTAMRGHQLAFAVSEDEARAIIAVTLGMITFIDDQVGRLVSTLKATGDYDNTIIVFNSDHGDFLGDYGLMLKFGIHNAGVTRVPFIWSDPRDVASRGAVRSDLASSLDIGPSFLAAAGMDCFSGAQGRDLFDAAIPEPDGLLIEEESQRPVLGMSHALVMRSLVTRDWRLTLSVGNGNHELVHLARDPGETRNLWDDPQSAGTRHRLTEQMALRMIELADRTPLPTSRA
ncbi:sulfatase-like hydrolase/transferase [Pseudooceanicola sp. 216_PA32_1]|uniref:Sulfatase-like hydrolase/transferase n=1 Tax=Pseudooceanicola pacificus TaxID=2676438 RepID=A0A844WEH3_9RHOB|nr:sulfatase-like hydrolase/transferase [Pseudooceanicola pacificus]MWB79062.1 sulfatase-like hydrolase/transferase [Pseudooceanicola pacificus]